MVFEGNYLSQIWRDWSNFTNSWNESWWDSVIWSVKEKVIIELVAINTWKNNQSYSFWPNFTQTLLPQVSDLSSTEKSPEGLDTSFTLYNRKLGKIREWQKISHNRKKTNQNYFDGKCDSQHFDGPKDVSRKTKQFLIVTHIVMIVIRISWK